MKNFGIVLTEANFHFIKYKEESKRIPDRKKILLDEQLILYTTINCFNNLYYVLFCIQL